MRRRCWFVVGAVATVAACGGGGGGVDGQIAALAAAFVTDDGGDLDDDVATCVAEELVAVLDADAIEELDGPAEAVLDADLDDLGIDPDDPDDGADLFELYDDCDVDADDIDADDLRGLAGEATEVALLAAYGESLAEVVERDPALDGEVDGGEAACAGEVLGRLAGLEVLAEIGEPSEVEEAEAVVALRLEVDDGEELAELLDGCELDLLGLGQLAIEEADVIDEEGASCVVDELGDERAARLGALSLLVGAEDVVFGDADDELGDDVFDALDICFEELDLGDDDDPEPPAFLDEEYVASLTGALVQDPVPFDPAAAACVAEAWSNALGPSFFSEILLIEPTELAVLDDLAQAGFISADTDLLLEAVNTCQVPVQHLLLSMLGTAPLTPEQVACFVGAVADVAVAEVAIDAVLTDGQLPPADDPAGVAVAGALNGCGIAG